MKRSTMQTIAGVLVEAGRSDLAEEMCITAKKPRRAFKKKNKSGGRGRSLKDLLDDQVRGVVEAGTPKAQAEKEVKKWSELIMKAYTEGELINYLTMISNPRTMNEAKKLPISKYADKMAEKVIKG